MSKVIIILLLLAMIVSLGVGLFHLLKSPTESDRGDKVVTALTWRIGIWIVLFAFIFLSMKMGWLKPSNSVHPIKFNQEQKARMNESEN